MRRRAIWLLAGVFLLTSCRPPPVPADWGMMPAPPPFARSVTVTAAPSVASPTAPPAVVLASPSRALALTASTPAPTPTGAEDGATDPSLTLPSSARFSGEPAGTATDVAPTANATVIETRAAPQATLTPEQSFESAVRIAVIGDYGLATPGEEDVANLVKSWRPDLVITTGDNNYPGGSPDTIDLNIGRFYHEFITPYVGKYGIAAEQNRFFPTLGNHDWMDPGARAYLDYFTLPGNERYYDVAWGPVHLFVLDSMPDEPDGIKATSRQATWLREGLAAATEPWKLVTMHHPPFSSGPHGPTPVLQWPYAEWRASAVLAGHDHTYERILRDGIVYFVNGLGGSVRYAVGEPVEGSQVRFDEDFGAMLIDADQQQITFQFITRAGRLVDSYTLTR